VSSGLYSGVSGLALGSGLYRNVSGLWGGASGLTAGFGGGSPYGGASLYLDFLSMTAPTFDNRITFTRGSNATLTDSTGKLTYAPANLLTYSEQFDNAAWTKTATGTGVVPIVTANAGTSPNGTLNADRIQLDSGAAGQSSVNQTAAGAPSGTPGVFSIWLRSLASDVTVTLFYGASVQNVTVTASWQRFTFTVAAPASGEVRIAKRDAWASSGAADVLAWGAQLEPVTYQTTPGTYVGTTSTAYYGPRFDYDPVTLAAKGLLVEEARTNLLTYSSDWTNAAWSKTNITVTAAATASPDGTVNAQKLAATATAVANNLSGSIVVAATSATYSIYVKQGTSATIANTFALRNITTATTLILGTLNYATGVWTYSTGSTGVSVSNAGNGWWRLQITATTGITSGDSLSVYVGFAGGAATAGDFLYAYGAQLEAGAFATSYTPTVASTVTRSADVATMTGTNFSSWYNQSEGTFVVQADSLTLSSVGWLLTASDGTSNNRFGHYRSGANLGGYVVTATVTQMDLTLASVVANTPFKSSVAATFNDGNTAFNGAIAAGDTSITMPTLNKLEIGANTGAIYNGHIREIAYFNTRLPNAQLQTLTAPALTATLSLDFTSGAYTVGF